MADASRKIVLVSRSTRLAQLVQRFNTRDQARFYIERLGGDFDDYQAEDDRFRQAHEAIAGAALGLCRLQLLDWVHSPNFLFAPDDLVATVGQDGLIVNTLRYLGQQAIIGFNPDAARWDGLLAQFGPGAARENLEQALAGNLVEKAVSRARVTLSDGQQMTAVNDFFLGVSDHSSARYVLSAGDRSEAQSSSGLIVSTPLGRTGWLQSVINGASGVINAMRNEPIKVRPHQAGRWDDDHLHFAVREPYASVSSRAGLVFGKINPGHSLTVESRMGEKGLIFGDGIQGDFLSFNYSVKAEFSLDPQKGRLLVKA